MVNYQQITELYGSPLNTVPKPNVPFKLKTWHVIGGIVVLSILAYGTYAFHRDFILKDGPKFNDNIKD